MTLAGEERKSALVVPEGAVQASEQGFVTYVVEKRQGAAAAHPDRPAHGRRASVEILSGLKPGETVVTEGSDRLADGIPVEVVGGRAAAGGGRRRAAAGGEVGSGHERRDAPARSPRRTPRRSRPG